MSSQGENIDFKLGFDQVRNLLAAFCVSTLGREMVEHMSFESSYSKIAGWQKEGVEMMALLQLDAPEFSDLDDCREVLDTLKVKGTVLQPDHFLALRRWMVTAKEWREFLMKHGDTATRLKGFCSLVTFDESLINKITKVFEDNGEVKNNASQELAGIRAEKMRLEKKSHNLIHKLFGGYLQSGYIAEGGTVSIRNGRLVIPVAAEYKRRVPGYIQGQSVSGNIIFMEPAEVMEASNDLVACTLSENREILKILEVLTASLHAQYAPLNKLPMFIQQVDFIRTKAKFAIDNGYHFPTLTDKPGLTLREAYHPLLKKANSRDGKKTIPLSLDIHHDQRIIMVSGPNAGGKSVSLKTVGLLQWMVQCGLAVPVGESSVIGVFGEIMIDIGDDQSIENDLSTYSSHLLHMKKMLKGANDRTLILIDEFGTGTEPNIGGAIAEVILKALLERGARGVITTHYLNLKEFADRQEGIVNASMRFDMENLMPLYVMETGRPGSSFAIEIARKIGLPQGIIEEAKKLAGVGVTSFDQLTAKLERQKERLEKREKSAKNLERELLHEKEKYTRLSEKLESTKSEILKKAREEAERLLSGANREIEKTIRHIKETKAHKGETQKVRQKLELTRKKVEEKLPEKKGGSSVGSAIKVGDRVRIQGHSVTGLVKKLTNKGKTAEVEFNGMVSRVDIPRLEKTGSGIGEKQPETSPGKRTIDLVQKRSTFNPSLDIRGKRAEEALGILDKFLDDAILLGASEIRILHGKGDGVLRKLAREALGRYSQVEGFSDEHEDFGGAGVTVVILK